MELNKNKILKNIKNLKRSYKNVKIEKNWIGIILAIKFQYVYRLPCAEMFSELRFAIPVEISTRPPRKTNEYQHILARSSRICKNHIQTVTTKVKSDKSR